MESKEKIIRNFFKLHFDEETEKNLILRRKNIDEPCPTYVKRDYGDVNEKLIRL